MSNNNAEAEFTEFFQSSWEPCLRAVTVIADSPQLAEDQVAEAFAKAWVSWRKVSRHPAPRAWVVRAALNTGGRSGCTCPRAWRRCAANSLLPTPRRPINDHPR